MEEVTLCRSLTEEELMCMSPTVTAIGCGLSQGLAITHCQKEQDVAGDGGHTEVGQHFSGSNICALAPR